MLARVDKYWARREVERGVVGRVLDSSVEDVVRRVAAGVAQQRVDSDRWPARLLRANRHGNGKGGERGKSAAATVKASPRCGNATGRRDDDGHRKQDGEAYGDHDVHGATNSSLLPLTVG